MDIVKQLCPYSTGLNGQLVKINMFEIAKAKGHQGVVTELSSA